MISFKDILKTHAATKDEYILENYKQVCDQLALYEQTNLKGY